MVSRVHGNDGWWYGEGIELHYSDCVYLPCVLSEVSCISATPGCEDLNRLNLSPIIFQTALASKTVICIIRRTDLFSCEPMSSEEPAASVVG